MRTPAHPCFHAPGRLILCAVLAVALAACGSKGTGGGATDGGTDGGTVGGTDGGTTGSISGPGVYGGLPGQPAEARAVDPANPDNASLDTDCDGISDAEELSATHDDGAGTSKHTEAANPDTDGDGLPDGLELGRTQNIEPARCTGYFKADSDPATTTNPVNADTDGDGVRDGVEDLNQDGKLDSGEGDPKDSGSKGTTTVVNACSDEHLVQVVFDRSQPADVQLATVGFTDKLQVTVGGVEKGWLYWNPDKKIGAFALEKATVETDVASMESAGRTAFAEMGGSGPVSNPLVQTFTTWDAYPGMKATYNWAAAGDAKALLNTIATTFAGSDASQWSNTAGVTGSISPAGWVLRVEYVRRSDSTADIVGAFAPASDYTGEAVALTVDDVVNGSAFAQSDDTASVQCEAFQAQAYSKLDILWVVDNSGSMGNDQEAVKAAGDQMLALLENAPIDWRMALVTTAYYRTYNTSNATRDLKPFTSDIDTVKCWFDQTCADWITTDGTGTEKALLSAKDAIDQFLPSTASTDAKIRPDAHLVLIFLSDTDDQDTTTTANHCGSPADPKKCLSWSPAQYVTYFGDYDPVTPANQAAQVHGVLCKRDNANDPDCTDDLGGAYTRVISVVRSMQGVLGNIVGFEQPANSAATLDAIIRAAAGSASPYVLAKAPISASFKVALQGPTAGTCGGVTTNVADVPRNRTDGFDYYAPTNSILFYGDCRPSSGQIALSYRYWVPGNCPADGCSADCSPTCAERQLCIHETNTCVWPADCGGICTTDQTCDTSNGNCVTNHPG